MSKAITAEAETLNHTKVAEMFKALGHPTRLSIVRRLMVGELNVGELMDSLLCDVKITQPGLSIHLKVLKKAGIVSPRSENRHIFYSLNHTEELKTVIQKMREVVGFGAKKEKKK